MRWAAPSNLIARFEVFYSTGSLIILGMLEADLKDDKNSIPNNWTREFAFIFRDQI